MLEWTETHFTAINNCNTYGLHLLHTAQGVRTVVATIDGKVTVLTLQHQLLAQFDLKTALGEVLDSGECLEMVTVDVAATSVEQGPSDRHLALLASCWIVCDHLGSSVRFLAALFSISLTGACLVARVDLATPPTYCRLTDPSPTTHAQHAWLIFTAGRAVRCLLIEPNSLAFRELESIGEVYPELELGALPGAALHSSCLTSTVGRWSAIGSDTGYVIASVSSNVHNEIMDRAELKFSGAVSVLEYLPSSDDSDDDTVNLLISSTLGPAAIWSLSFVDDKLKWHMKCELEASDRYDCVICGSVGDDVVCIGAYGQCILMYSTSDISVSPRVSPKSMMHLPAPVLALRLLDDRVIFLSSKGCHSYQSSHMAPFSLPPEC